MHTLWSNYILVGYPPINPFTLATSVNTQLNCKLITNYEGMYLNYPKIKIKTYKRKKNISFPKPDIMSMIQHKDIQRNNIEHEWDFFVVYIYIILNKNAKIN